MCTYFLKNMKMDTDEQLDEEIHRVRCWRVPSASASISVKLGDIALSVQMCMTTWKLSL